MPAGRAGLPFLAATGQTVSGTWAVGPNPQSRSNVLLKANVWSWLLVEGLLDLGIRKLWQSCLSERETNRSGDGLGWNFPLATLLNF